MSRYLEAIRELYWSDLCSTDRDAYLAYLRSVDNGVSTFSVGCVDGAAKLLRGGGGCVGDDFTVESQGCGDDVEKEVGMVVGVGVAGLVVDSQDNGDCGFGSQRSGGLGGGLSVDSVDNCFRRVGDVGGDVSLGHGRCDDGSVGNPAVDAGTVVDGSAAKRGRNYYSNKKKREQRKNRAKAARMAGSWRASSVVLDDDCVDQNVPTLAEFVNSKADSEILEDKAKDVEARLASCEALRNAKTTLAKRWAVENELAAEKAKRALEVLRAQDLDVEIKRQSTRLRLHTERNMVGMEKAHQFLKNTGNVPGFAQTVLSDGGLTEGSSASPASPGECTISPDSSASMKDYRELVKKCADQQAKLDQFHKMTKIHPDYIELYKKQTWTINSENIRILDEMYPQGHALNPIPDYENYDAPTHGELIVGSDEEYFPY